MDNQILPTLLRWAITLLLPASVMAHAQTGRLQVGDGAWEIQSAQHPAVSGTDDAKELDVKVEEYNTFIWDLGIAHDAREEGKNAFPDWYTFNQLAIHIPEDQWDYAYHVLLDAYDWMTGRVKTPAYAADTDSVRAGLSPGVRTNSTLATGLAIYNYTVRRLKEKLDDDAFQKLYGCIDQVELGIVRRQRPPSSDPTQPHKTPVSHQGCVQ